MRTLLAALLGTVGLTLATAGGALADQVYHTEWLELTATGAPGHPELVNGQVVNIHANGPQVGAIENYRVTGAAPNTAYTVVLTVTYGCDGGLRFDMDTATLETNKHGNGHAQFVFAPSQLAGVSGQTVGAPWTLVAGGVVAYETACTTVTLD